MTETKQVPVERLRQLKVYSDQHSIDEMLSAGCSVVCWEELDALLCDAELAAAPAAEPTEIERLAVEIADEAAWGVIFCESKWRSLDGENWYDTGFAERDGDSVDAEVKCLELRGLLEHHPDHPELVRVKETPTQREGESDGR